ncbi:MAG: DNA-binding protein [Oscillospiraceae bacterium]|nr:DNA-binding protein [Oscillospiraceae bacterium]MBQ5749574.1 DNA-binding protein [Oscillospiraceae bacterium]
MKQDALSMTLLYDYYGELLTEKQKTCFDLHYNQDLSLGEIAQEAGISRQGVHDTLMRAEALLRNMEEKTGCIARDRRTQSALAEICEAAAELANDPHASELARRILDAAERIKE